MSKLDLHWTVNVNYNPRINGQPHREMKVKQSEQEEFLPTTLLNHNLLYTDISFLPSTHTQSGKK